MQTEGIILKATPYQEGHSIVTLFSHDLGVIRLFARRRRKQPPPTPLTQVACTYSSRRDDTLPRLGELQILNPFLDLRDRFETLQLAGSLAQTLLQSQLLWKPAPLLYQLLLHYLLHIPSCSQTDAVYASFLLKLLRHEGLLAIQDHCSQCKQPLQGAALTPGEVLCPTHSPNWAIHFHREELNALSQLSLATSLQQINETALIKGLGEKTKNLFDQLMERD